jgi:hypothetical protein
MTGNGSGHDGRIPATARRQSRGRILRPPGFTGGRGNSPRSSKSRSVQSLAMVRRTKVCSGNSGSSVPTALIRLVQGRTVVMTTHRPALIRLATRTIDIHDGAIQRLAG